MVSFSSLCTAALLASYAAVMAHPGHNVAEEAAERAEFFKRNPKTIRSCASKLKARGHEQANIARRQALARNIRAKRGLSTKPIVHRRDFSSYNFTHLVDDPTISTGLDEAVLFADNSSCTLQTDVTQGPYYVTGELVRENITEDQIGIPLTLDIQVIDTSTCEPVPALYMDLWHCNATGVYSGVVASGNGNTNDTANLNKTALRGIQQTNRNGILQFETIFPGHYTSRATHIHILTHNPNSTTIRVNDTLLDTNATTVRASHVGQLFFDQDLITQADTIEPYSSNTQQVTPNSVDSILSEEADTTDPFVEYALLGDSLEDGILAWISIGIDPTEDSEITSAAVHYKDGGVTNSDGGMGMGGGGGGGGGAPSGSAMPAGTAVPTM
ncbi:hypothetical protein A1O1_00408 [Capronia coronata CBS 617.96]|uniref:Intradiol ring-cleavage dioxygenases domain-containing protein n=1 Tax=Capronia coronata CBS 617.96 TaxID=1182541 RepID=W9YRT9_9EURO|nr:uncharacterized protein A1O1_00408 [Capronia coronata CBS 617.96]EXJ95288.1 hypothetical protein A1O1_00408 [Capronia coronata CBS 617.96]